ncbi:hypothetical protein PHYSODRAFT_513215 [Phytophthora sojae]|uniref:Uncharacterized protein n=1 Tax=Phytophthora sojae (strain P6497) TaxID=1094619 RepID=G4ZSZ6_PHYSP|nr:hypothetical protein PHYSODRAFT_513215 [Phytophthora sojae]EGZ13081.1 hypothetical protein PHYSODRAFT_513215 [Phytophthora sojae]|eukprot:XP_009530510.1 hypothetical protein PHYSODRAFT_513215 [Phytophthora sojae]
MASNNPSACNVSPSRVGFRSGPTSPPAPGKVQVPTYDSDGLESDDETLLALSSLPKMESIRAPRQVKPANYQQEQPIISSNAVLDLSSDCIDVVQQAIDAVEEALARCPKYERREALTELLMHAKLEQARKATAHSADCYQHANVWAAMLMQVQELGRNYPKDPQVHQLVYLVQQCVARGEKHEVPEHDEHESSTPYNHQQEDSELVVEEETHQQELEDDTDLCGRMGEAAVDVDGVLDDDDGDIGYRITEDILEPESNQAEDESGDDDELKHDDDRDTSSHHDDTEIEELDEPVKPSKQSKKYAAASPTSRLRVLLPILTANIIVKGVQVPRLPRGSDGGYSSSDSDKSDSASVSPRKPVAKVTGRSSRQKFQFREKELLQLLEDEEAKPGSALSPGLLRRFSPNSKITGTVPLRRKSFSMKRSPLKSTAFAGFGPLPVVAQQTRRNSKSFSVTKHQILAFNNIKKVAAAPRKTSSGSPRSLSKTASPASPVSGTQTQMVLRVRERPSDGVPELVIAKKPVRFVVWHWNDRCIRVPFMSAANFMELGPAQHGIMLRQLRYVKSMMHELPWAKAHLRSLLSRYTAKEVSKEELYPQLNALGLQVQREIGSRAKQHRALTARKQRLTVTLTLATSVVNDTLVTKFGRRGRPHASRLLYDPTTPLQLRWRRKHGERSVEYLAVDEIEVIEAPDASRLSSGNAGTFGRGNKKAAAAVAVDPESCLSLVTPSRSLDLQVASALHCEWLANAIRDIVSFAQQYKAAKTGASSSDEGSSSDSMPGTTAIAIARRPRQLPLSRNVMLY